ncbi:MAG TPA: site-2 protease family protein [Dokdonella sp.]
MDSPGFLIAVALVLGGLALMQLLWQILCFPIAAPRGFRQLRQLPVTPALAGPVEAAQAELGALGFERDGWVIVDALPNEANPMRVFGCMRHRSEPVLAAIQLRPELQQVENCRVVFQSLLADGRLLRTYNHVLHWLPPHSPFEERQDAYADTLAAQWAFHRAGVHARGTEVARLPTTARMVDLALENDRRLIEWRLRHGQFERDRAGVVRFSVRSALGLLRRGLFPPRRASVRNMPVSPERQAILFNHWAWTQEQAPRLRVQWAFFAMAALAFVLLGAAFWSVATALAIFLVLIVHEAGHYAAMRIAGYRNLSIRMIPLIGGVTTGSEQHPSALRRAWISLMGPLPGIVIGWLLLAFRHLDASGSVALLATSFLVINGFNLLPLPPLDGGRFLLAIVPPRYARIAAFVEGGLLVVALLFCLRMQALLLVFVAALQLVLLPQRMRLGDVIEKLAQPPGVVGAPRMHDQIVRIAAVLDQSPFGLTPMVRRMPLIKRVYDELRLLPASRLQASLLAILYAVLFALALPTASRLLPGMSERGVDWPAQLAEISTATASIAAQAHTLDVAHLVAAFREDPGGTDARIAAVYDHDAVDARFAALLGRVASADEHRALAAGVVVDDYEPQTPALQALRDAAPFAYAALAGSTAHALQVRDESSGEARAVDIDALGAALAFARKSRSQWLVLPRVADGAAQPVWAVDFIAGQPPIVVEHADLRDWFALHWQAMRVQAMLRERGMLGDAGVPDEEE